MYLAKKRHEKIHATSTLEANKFEENRYICLFVKVRRTKINNILKVCDLDFPLHILNVRSLHNLNGGKLLIRLSQDPAD